LLGLDEAPIDGPDEGILVDCEGGTDDGCDEGYDDVFVVTSGIVVREVVDEKFPLEGAPVDPRDCWLLGFDEDCEDVFCEGWLDG